MVRSHDEQILDLGAKRGSTPFVGVEKEDPRIPDMLEGPVLLSSGAEVGALEIPHLVVALSNLRGSIGGERVDHDDLVAPLERLDTGADVVLLVEAGDETAHLRSGPAIVQGRHFDLGIHGSPSRGQS